MSTEEEVENGEWDEVLKMWERTESILVRLEEEELLFTHPLILGWVCLKIPVKVGIGDRKLRVISLASLNFLGELKKKSGGEKINGVQ